MVHHSIIGSSEPQLQNSNTTDAKQQVNSKVMSNSRAASSCSLLRVSGTQIVNPQNEPILLKGAGLGGHLNMENFITGYPGHEHEHRAALADVLGETRAKFFFDKFLEYFFTEFDAEFYASLGLNCIRVPFNYRHFIDDQEPTGHVKPEGFYWLDRVVEICARYNLYVILDLHAAPGGQNQDWHSDTGIAKAMFWEHRVLQDQATDLWVQIASHYKGNPVIAGYNLLNEPADPHPTRLVAWYKRTEKAVRAVDPHHILFIDGNTYAMDFSMFTKDDILPNAVYACHDYAMLGFPIPGQAPYSGTPEQNEQLQKSFDRKREFMDSHGVPCWNGEFGPVYADPRVDKDAKTTNAARLAVLKQQLSMYKETQTSWSIWLYKDIGYQGMVYVDPETPYMKLISDFVAKKQALGLDFWGVVDKSVVDREAYQPFISALKKTIPEHLLKRKYPKTWAFDRQVERLIREGLMSEYMGWEFAELFQGKTETELDELAASFKLENCLKRDGLNETLTADANGQ